MKKRKKVVRGCCCHCQQHISRHQRPTTASQYNNVCDSCFVDGVNRFPKTTEEEAKEALARQIASVARQLAKKKSKSKSKSGSSDTDRERLELIFYQ